MHIAEGILSAPVLLVGGAAAAVGVAVGLRTLRDEEIPQTALLTSAFFAASLLHFPLGPSSVHLMLTGLCGLLLGWRAFPAILVALVLQATLFGFGGIIVLGVNTTILAGPAVLIGLPMRRWIRRRPERGAVAGAICGGTSILGSALLASAALVLSHRSFTGVAALMMAGAVPLMAIEAVITAGIVHFLLRVRPEFFHAAAPHGAA
jgi:cobalt/nickel transport system permease protein